MTTVHLYTIEKQVYIIKKKNIHEMNCTSNMPQTLCEQTWSGNNLYFSKIETENPNDVGIKTGHIVLAAYFISQWLLLVYHMAYTSPFVGEHFLIIWFMNWTDPFHHPWQKGNCNILFYNQLNLFRDTLLNHYQPPN